MHHLAHKRYKKFGLLAILYLLGVVTGCNHHPGKTTPAKPRYADSTTLITFNPHDQEIYHPVTAFDCPVYASPDSTSKVITRLPVITLLNITKNLGKSFIDTVKSRDGKLMYLSSKKNTWYQVKLGDDKTAYVSRDYVANISITDSALNAIYIIGRKQPSGNYFVARYNLNEMKEVGEVLLGGFRSDYIRVSEVKHIAMKGISKLLRVDEDLEESGGEHVSQLIADARNGLITFPLTTISYDDGAGRENKLIYVPARGGDGILHLYIDADIHNDVRWRHFFIESRTDMGVPPGELLVYVEEEGETAVGPNNEPILQKSGNYTWKSHVKYATYYRWDGAKFTQVYFEKIPLPLQ